MEIKHTVLLEDENRLLKNVLRNRMNISARLLIKLKNNNAIFVNDVPEFVNYEVKANDVVKIVLDFEEEDYIIPEKMDLNIIYEDDSLFILNKPADIVVHPSSYHLSNTLANGVKFHLNTKKKVRPVNRLDRETSGIILFAKNEYVQEKLSRSSEYKKEYLAIVNGIVEDDEGTIDVPIARKENSIMEREVNFVHGQTAITHYKVLKRSKKENLSLVHVTLGTGRTHQIRIHFGYIGHKLLGDTLYGCESRLIKRHALHAWKTSFKHPITNEQIVLTADIPDDMQLVINKLDED